MPDDFPIDIGRDAEGDRHLVWDNSGLHEPSHLCGCNPDPYHDEQDDGLNGGWWWGHDILSAPEEKGDIE